MNEYKDFSSLPPDVERTFVPFEKAAVENGKKAWRIAFISCAVFLAAVLTLVFTSEPPKPKMSDEEMTDLRGGTEMKKAKAAAPEKTEDEAAAPAEEAAAEEGSDDKADEDE